MSEQNGTIYLEQAEAAFQNFLTAGTSGQDLTGQDLAEFEMKKASYLMLKAIYELLKDSQSSP